MLEVAVVGDIHGNFGPLKGAIHWLEKSWSGHIVFVGDYVNRGTDSKKVLDALIQFKASHGDRVTFLLGNHEMALLDFLEHNSLDTFFAHGGISTVRSYVGSRLLSDPLSQFKDEFPAAHLQFLHSLLPSFETADVLITHSGFAPERPLSRAVEDVVLGGHPEIFKEEISPPAPLVVFGHYAQRTKRAFVAPKKICIDSGCGVIPGAPLSVITLPDQTVYTFSEDREQ